MSSDPSSMPLSLQLGLIALFVILNGVVVLMNTAMNAVNRTKLRQEAEDDSSVEKLLALLENPTDYRFTNRLLSYVFMAAGLVLAMKLPFEDVSSILVYVAVSITFSEYFTRKLAQQHTEFYALSFSGLEKVFLIMLKPLW